MTPRPSQPVLMLSSYGGIYGRRSGYPLLAEFVPESRLLLTERMPPKGWDRILRFVISRPAVTSYYQLASAKLEWLAWRELRTADRSILHVLWADSDYGMMDWLLDRDRITVVGTFHAPTSVLRGIIRYPHRLRKLDALILMSETQRAYFVSAGVANEKIHVIYHGIDTDVFRPAAQPPAREPFTLISVGNYLRNLPLLRDVCLALASRPDIRFRIVANPRITSEFSGLPNVEGLSGLSDEELISSYQTSSCLLLTVKDATANNGLLEGMACGLPVLAEDVGGIREYTQGDAAILTTPNSCEELMVAILRLSSSPELCHRMGLAARRRAEELDWRVVAAQTMELYESCQRSKESQRVA